MKVFTICIIACLAISRVFAINPALAAAVAANPDKFAEAAGKLGKDSTQLVIDYQNWIKSMPDSYAFIINETDKPITFQAFDKLNPAAGAGAHFAVNTVFPHQRQTISSMGGSSTIILQITNDGYGFGSYRENFMFFVNRGGVYNVKKNLNGIKHKTYVTEWVSTTKEPTKKCARRLRRRLAVNRRLADATFNEGGSFFNQIKSAAIADPNKFVDAFGQIGKDSLEVAQNVSTILRNMDFNVAKIYNKTKEDIEWFCYNSQNFIRVETWMKAYMGPDAIISATCNPSVLGGTTCTCYPNNKSPGQEVKPGFVYQHLGNGSLNLVGNGDVCF